MPVARSRRRRAAPNLSRPGYLAVPHALLYSRRFSPEQKEALLKVMACARWERTPGVEIEGRGYSITLDAGEALISVRDFPRTHLGRDGEAGRSFLRRVLLAAEGEAIVSTRPALPADPRPSPGSGHRSDPPPTIVRVLKWRDWMFPSNDDADPPPDPAAVANPTPYNQATIHPSPITGTDTSPTAHKDFALGVPDSLKQVKKVLEAKIGRKLAIPPSSRSWERAEVIDTFTTWIRSHGEDEVIAACFKEAAQRAEHDQETYSLLYLAQAAERIGDNHVPGETPHRFGANLNPPPRWRALFDRVNVAQYLAIRAEMRSLRARKHTATPDTDEDWAELLAKWSRVVGVKG